MFTFLDFLKTRVKEVCFIVFFSRSQSNEPFSLDADSVTSALERLLGMYGPYQIGTKHVRQNVLVVDHYFLEFKVCGDNSMTGQGRMLSYLEVGQLSFQLIAKILNRAKEAS